MIRGRCPICSKPFAVPVLADLPSFPFCSARCRRIDLGRWIDGSYTLPGHEVRSPLEQAEEGREEDDA